MLDDVDALRESGRLRLVKLQHALSEVFAESGVDEVSLDSFLQHPAYTFHIVEHGLEPRSARISKVLKKHSRDLGIVLCPLRPERRRTRYMIRSVGGINTDGSTDRSSQCQHPFENNTSTFAAGGRAPTRWLTTTDENTDRFTILSRDPDRFTMGQIRETQQNVCVIQRHFDVGSVSMCTAYIDAGGGACKSVSSVVASARHRDPANDTNVRALSPRQESWYAEESTSTSTWYDCDTTHVETSPVLLLDVELQHE